MIFTKRLVKHWQRYVELEDEIALQENLVLSLDDEIFVVPQTGREEHVLDALAEVRDGVEWRPEEVQADDDGHDPQRDDIDVGEDAEAREIEDVHEERTSEENDIDDDQKGADTLEKMGNKSNFRINCSFNDN